MMPEDGIDTLRGFDAIFLGAVGWPARVPDSDPLHGPRQPIRKAFAQTPIFAPTALLGRVEGPLKSSSASKFSGARKHRAAEHSVPAAACMLAPPTR